MTAEPEVLVLNGGSSSGKSSIARRLQMLLGQPWAVFGIDDLLTALSPSLVGDAAPRPEQPALLRYGENGEVIIEPQWRRVESAWHRGLASMAQAGLGIILDEVLLDGAAAQGRLAGALDGLRVVWVGVHCDPSTAAAREARRPDRIAGMAASQAFTVHEGVRYDVLVDTTTASSEDCARAILAQMRYAPRV
jgi:chloramphenicol 3-O phosphotransferase